MAAITIGAPSVGSAQSESTTSSLEDVEAARALAKEGLTAVKEERFEDAIDPLSRSLALHRAPFTLYTLGLAYEGANRPAAALESFRQFLKLPSSEAMKPYQQPAREAVTELEERVAHVVLTVTPGGVDGLVLRIDGRRLPDAALGLPRLVDPGRHVVEADAPGYLPTESRFEVAAKGEARVALILEEDPAADVLAPVVSTEESMAPLVAQITLMSVGVVAVGAGITVGMVGYNQAKDAQYNDDADAEAARTKSLVGDVLAVSGGVVAGAGLIWLLVDQLGGEGDDEQEGPVAVAPWTGGDVAGLELVF